MAQRQVLASACHSESLADILERVLDKGVVIAGDIKIKLCDIELLTIQIRLLIASVDKAKEMGLTWWWQEPNQLPVSASEALSRRPNQMDQALGEDSAQSRQRTAREMSYVSQQPNA